MNLSVKERIGVVVCWVWFVFVVALREMGRIGDTGFLIGLVSIIIIMWVLRGRKKSNDTEKGEGN